MLGGIYTDLLVTVTLLFLSQTGTQCKAQNDFSLVPLPEWRTNSDYVSQCFYDRQNNLTCDWTRSQQRTVDGSVSILVSGQLGLEGVACLEFWYQAPVVANGSELRVHLKSSAGLVEIWSSSALPGNSWRQVFVPLEIITQGTRVVLEAVSIKGYITFNRIGVRRGSCGPQCESNTELWTDESTRCLCSAGQLSCSPSQCPKGQICGPQRGSSSGISTSGTCTIHSQTDCSTFDGVLFRFMDPCTYVLAKTCSPTEALPMFSVEVVSEKNGNSSVPTVQQVNVDTSSFRVSLLKKQTRRAVVNGVWRKLPLSLGGGTVNIRSNPAAVVLGTSFGLSVSYDSTGAVHVTLPSTYADQVCGLCGNFNHLRGDDFRKPDGTNAQDPTDLANSWQNGQTTSSCETVLVPHQCDPMEEAEYASELYCGGLLSRTGPFADCQSVLGAESYFRGCVFGMCSTHGDPGVLCETLQVYTDICKEAGVTIPIWRNSTFCPLQCADNSHYNSCADGCPEVCSSLDLAGSCGSCEERCECDSGFKLSGGKCVLAQDCGCWYNGKHYEKGKTFVKGECVEECQCIGNNDLRCTTIQCADNEVCKVKDGVKDCFPFKPATCRVYGDPHYITFDRKGYDFQGGCSYTLTTTCGGESSVQFSVIGKNMHPPLQNFTWSKLEAVILQVEDFNLTLNQNGKVYVKNSQVRLPYSTNGSFGSVWVYVKNNYILLETSFGLKMMVDGQNRLFLQVDEHYKYDLCGLCGTYSGYQGDDFVTPDGQNATESFEFGESWRVPDNNECTVYPNEPRLCDYNEETEAYNECNTLLRDAFKPCHETVHPTLYITSCVYDYCATNGDRHTICESLKSYVAACQVAGVDLPPWQTDTACADPPTTPTPTSPTPDQTFCPMNCDFENNLCGWEQLVQDSFDWKRHSGPTPSDLTGPNQDHTTGAGFYIYTEGNSVTHGDSARLLSSMCHYNGPLCLHFWYHMYGSATAMALNIYLLKANKATKLWSMMNNQGPEWHLGNIDISMSGPFQIIVEGIRGSNAQSDISIDDVSIHFGSCSGIFPGQVSGTELPSTTAVLPSHPVCNVDCSFNSDLCSWNQMITDAFDWTWQSGSTPTLMTGPTADHTGDGHYLYIEASSVTHGDTTRLISSKCSDSGPQCLQFWYHMYGSADTMGLHVYLFQNRVAEAVWWKRNDQGNMWHLAQVDFTTSGNFQIIIEGRRGSNEQSDVAIDDVKLYQGRCSDLSGVVTTSTPVGPDPPLFNDTANITVTPTVLTTADLINKDVLTETPDNRPPHQVCQLHCNFEQDLCKWSQLLTDVFDWTRHSGSTPTMMTGPSSDHTTGDGHYLYIEANSATLGDTARLISSECSDTGRQCLQFWYHMSGSADTMGLHVYLFQDRKANAVWRKRNDQGNMWHLAQVDLTTIGPFQIIFEGRRGSNDRSDVAIDDISLHHGHCGDLAKPTTSVPKTLDPVSTEVPPASSSSSTQPPTTTSTISQPPSTTTFTTTTATTTAAPTDCDTQTPTKPSATTEPPYTTNSDVPITTTPDFPTTGPHQPITSPTPQTTEHQGVETSEQPQPATTEIPPTPGPEQSTTYTEESQTTIQPQPPTTVRPQPPTETHPTTAKTTVAPTDCDTLTPTTPSATTELPYTSNPDVEMTTRPDVPTSGPHLPTTSSTIKPSTDGSSTTARPHSSATEHPEVETSEQPEPETTEIPQTAEPEQPTTYTEESQTTVAPQPPTTVRPQPPTTTATTTVAPTDCDTQTPTTPSATTELPYTSNPDVEMTTRPDVPTSEPQLPTTSSTIKPSTDGSSTTARPHSSATEHPEPETSEQPQLETTKIPQTTEPEQPTTYTEESQTAVPPQPPTTVRPQPPTETHPQPPTPTPFITTELPYTSNPDVEMTTKPDVPTSGPQLPTTSSTIKPSTDGSSTTARPHSSATEHPEPETSEQPELETTEIPQTAEPEQPTTYTEESQTAVPPQPPTTVRPQPPTTTAKTTVAPTDCDTQTPTTPSATTELPYTSNPDVEMTTRPDVPTSGPHLPTTSSTIKPSTDGSSTTARPHSSATEHPEVETSEQPELETTEIPQTAEPEQPTTYTEESQTTVAPQPPTTVRPQPPTTTATTTVAPTDCDTQTPTTPSATTELPYTSNPDVEMTTRPDVPTSEPQLPTTSSTIKPSTDGSSTTARPHSSATEHPEVETSEHPEPETSEQPELETTEIPQTTEPEQPTTYTEESQTAVPPQPPTTVRPQPPTETHPQPPTTTPFITTELPYTSNPDVEMTTKPDVPTSGPQLPTTSSTIKPSTDGSSTTARPHSSATEHPEVETSEQPEPETTEIPQTAEPEQPTTYTEESQTTVAPQPPTTVRPQPPTTTATTTVAPTDCDTQTPTTPSATTGLPYTSTPDALMTTRPQIPITSRPTTTSTNAPVTSETQPQTISTPQSPTTVKTQPTTATPNSTTTLSPQSTTTARSKPTTHVPTPSCPENSHYTTCIYACSPTCTHLNGPPHCSDSDSCVSGCVCDDGFVQRSQVCVPIQECGCVDRNGTKHQFHEVWYTSHCRQKCECKKDDGVGKIDCNDKDECDRNAVCLQNSKGEYYCVSTGFSECTINGEPEYRTFDRMKHDFEGEHSYVLVRTNNLPDNLSDVYIEGIYTRNGEDGDHGHHHGDRSSEENHSHSVEDEDNGGDDDDDNEDEDDEDYDDHEPDDFVKHRHRRLHALKIRVYSHTVEFKKNRRLVVDGERTNTPVSPSAGLHIREHSSGIYLKTDFGLSVKFSGRSSAEIILPYVYKRKVGGLCGNFDGESRNDLMKPDGTTARSVREFGESWRV